MYSIKGFAKSYLISGIFLLFLVNCSPLKPVSKKKQQDAEAKVISLADRLMAEHNYQKAHDLLSGFYTRFPGSVYVDDAAYRLAYLYVIDDPANPFLDYRQALPAFKELEDKYPQSRYISACKNWRKILNLYFAKNLKAEPVKTDNTELHKKIKKLEYSNNELRKALQELEKALQR